ncbi:MAG: DUF6089 family protein [Bacteroidales bacterium]
MKKLFYLFLGIVLVLLFPIDTSAQSRSPVQDRRPTVRPPSQSRPPGGTRRPLQLSRRSQLMQQFGWDIGGNIGTSHSLTDVSGSSVEQRPSFLNTQWNTTSINAGVFARYKFHPLIAVKGALNYGHIHGADSLAEGRLRNFYFSNNVFEFSVVGEFYIPKSSPNFPLNVYGFVGMAAFYHNPQLTVPDPDNFEFDDFSKFQPAIPMGLGLYYSLPNNFRIGYEIGWRKTFSDYLDGFTRVWSKGYDSYYFNKLTVSYFIPDRQGWARPRF